MAARGLGSNADGLDPGGGRAGGERRSDPRV